MNILFKYFFKISTFDLSTIRMIWMTTCIVMNCNLWCYGLVWYLWCYGTTLHGMVWYGMVFMVLWFGMVFMVLWYYTAWYGMAWYGIYGAMVLHRIYRTFLYCYCTDLWRDFSYNFLPVLFHEPREPLGWSLLIFINLLTKEIIRFMHDFLKLHQNT